VALTPYLTATAVLGITGPPGVGKSTTTSALIHHAYRSQGKRVGVLAIDPSSPFSYGPCSATSSAAGTCSRSNCVHAVHGHLWAS
jgi:GTPase SAR1 family protein